MKYKSVAVEALKCFNRLVLFADRETTIEECLTYESHVYCVADKLI